MNVNQKQDEMNPRRFANLTILQIMGMLAALGIISTWILRSFFAG